MELVPGVSVWSTNLGPEALKARLAATEAVPAATLPPPVVGVYEPGALVPSTAWRGLSDAEFRQLAGPGARDAPYHASVVLAAPAPDLVAGLAAVAAEQAQILEEQSLRGSPAALQDRMTALLARDDALAAFGPLLSVCAFEAPANMNTVTTGVDGLLAGLHVDTWDHLTLSARRWASNRMTINTGTQSRYLLFSPYPVAAFAEAMGWTSEDGLDVAHAFLLLGDRRVLRLEVRPGEAYIAPTDNLIHDASSRGGVEPDRALMLRGFVAPASSAPTFDAPGRPAAALGSQILPAGPRNLALAEAIAALGGSGNVMVAGETHGDINDIYRLETRAGESLAVRIRRQVFAQDADDWLVKSVICARLMGKPGARGQELATTDEAGVDALPFPISAAILRHRHGRTPTRPPWEVCEWLEGPLLADEPRRAHYVDLGRRLAALHTVSFPCFYPGLRPSRRPGDWDAWVQEQLRSFAVAALQARTGQHLTKVVRQALHAVRPARWSLLHGDIHAGNIVVTPAGVRLLDWDEARIGPPEFDLASLKRCTRRTASGEWFSDLDLYDATLEGYRAAGGVADGRLLLMGELVLRLKGFRAGQMQDAWGGATGAVDGIAALAEALVA